MFKTLLAAFLLFILWLLLSGHIEALLLSLGIASCLFAAWLANSLSLLNHDSAALRFNFSIPKFLPWFFIELIKSNLDVSRRILDPKLPIEPTFSTVPISQHSDIAKAVYANCITLTPGTYSININNDTIEVHCLTKQSAADMQKGEMSKRILSLESTSNSGHVKK